MRCSAFHAPAFPRESKLSTVVGPDVIGAVNGRLLGGATV
ncbi:hypothetical protein SBC1_76370 (plasmid) [Caballeronia sp. SBC1]|nr:hypothetical protein SBC2_79550 [Caballeronia sp. SBC2]QIN67590.1 hypothetical protein SBC1_76370 [Caballeronia sp. SBC1]